jgi:hypothetical protein
LTYPLRGGENDEKMNGRNEDGVLAGCGME